MTGARRKRPSGPDGRRSAPGPDCVITWYLSVFLPLAHFRRARRAPTVGLGSQILSGQINFQPRRSRPVRGRHRYMASKARLRLDSRYQSLRTDDIYRPFQIVGQHMETHFGSHMPFSPRQEVRVAHPGFECAKGVFCCTSTCAHTFRFSI